MPQAVEIDRASVMIERVRPIIGMEVHVELRTRSKMFSRAPSPAHPEFQDAGPNELLDPTVLGLPGALPTPNRAAVEMAMLVGLALGCRIAERTKWDRKSYFYPDLPKAYQISQYDLPLCFDGAMDVPGLDERGDPDVLGPTARIGIVRAHLEEDAGKLLHEAPGGGPIDGSIVDLNRAGTPLLEIVTAPDFDSAERCVAFAKLLRAACRFLGVTEGVMQRGHVRFEPNINCELTLAGGRTVRTPITEVKNLNSFRSLQGAIEFELREQPERWRADGLEFAPGTKRTRGWDDVRGRTFLQREKEEAEDYRYFPDPDLPPVVVDAAWRERVRASLPELPAARIRRYVKEEGLSVADAWLLVEHREVSAFYEAAADEAVRLGLPRPTAAKRCADLLVQSGLKRVNERAGAGAGGGAGGGAGSTPPLLSELGIGPEQVGRIAALREEGKISAAGADELFGVLCEPEWAGKAGVDPATLAAERGLVVVRDEAALERWADEVIAAHPGVVEQIRGGKGQAIGRLIGEVMKLSGGKADAKAVREVLERRIGA